MTQDREVSTFFPAAGFGPNSTQKNIYQPKLRPVTGSPGDCAVVVLLRLVVVLVVTVVVDVLVVVLVLVKVVVVFVVVVLVGVSVVCACVSVRFAVCLRIRSPEQDLQPAFSR